ncbi:hypothetical protein [Dickeya ananatis]|uniref:hypothetical protein n=1 Tax=Dickeya ananatis TaxID=3061286 RepID=UPI00388FE846
MSLRIVCRRPLPSRECLTHRQDRRGWETTLPEIKRGRFAVDVGDEAALAALAWRAPQ